MFSSISLSQFLEEMSVLPISSSALVNLNNVIKVPPVDETKLLENVSTDEEDTEGADETFNKETVTTDINDIEWNQFQSAPVVAEYLGASDVFSDPMDMYAYPDSSSSFFKDIDNRIMSSTAPPAAGFLATSDDVWGDSMNVYPEVNDPSSFFEDENDKAVEVYTNSSNDQNGSHKESDDDLLDNGEETDMMSDQQDGENFNRNYCENHRENPNENGGKNLCENAEENAINSTSSVENVYTEVVSEVPLDDNGQNATLPTEESLNGSGDTKLQTLDKIESKNIDSISKNETSPEEKTLNTEDKEMP